MHEAYDGCRNTAAVDWEIGTSDPWNYAIDTATAPIFKASPSAGWTPDFPFSTDEYPFYITVQARRLPLSQWGYWENSKITANLPPSPLNSVASVGPVAEEDRLPTVAAECALATKLASIRQAAGDSSAHAEVVGCNEDVQLRLVPYGGTNIRISVFPWFN